jgi:hypothetical protein
MTKNILTEHSFSAKILEVLLAHFGEDGKEIFNSSPIIGYINTKTKAANRGSKARGAFANHYALYVVIEDYIQKGFFDGDRKGSYQQYEGARFSDLFKRQRELPFGSKLQNHALNSRLNDEFKKFYPLVGKQPIVREVATQRYWIQEDLLQVEVRRKDGTDTTHNIAAAVIDIIDAYVATKRAAFEGFLDACKQIAELGEKDPSQAIDFVNSQLQPNVDARVFEIVSYAVLKSKYSSETIWIGDTRETVSEEFLVLYKTGRTNANDGGIDFVMRPLGRFFQVTETIDVNKYFLDIDKVQRFPITFVVKTNETSDQIREKIRQQAVAKYKIDAVVNSYMSAIEEIINTDDLSAAFSEVIRSGKLSDVMQEVVNQSKVEFNYEESETDEIEAELEQLDL